MKKRSGVDPRLLDLRDFPMPFFDQPVSPAMPGRPPYENEVVKKWTAAVAQSDGFVFVTPEYNYGPAQQARVDFGENLAGDGRQQLHGVMSHNSGEPSRNQRLSR